MRPLSYTQISQYQSCPLCYKLQYIDGLKPKDKWYFSFGLTMHTCAEHLFKVNVPPPPSLEELLEFYERNWLGVGYESAEEEAKYKEKMMAWYNGLGKAIYDPGAPLLNSKIIKSSGVSEGGNPV